MKINNITLTENDAIRFWKNVDIRKQDECWYWLAGTGHDYGRFRIKNTSFSSHRIALAISGIKVLKNNSVLHSRKCTHNALLYFGNGKFSRLCCNPNHLRLGTAKDNAADTVATGMAKGLFNGSIYNFGETHPFAKLSSKDVEEIRNSKERNKDLAARYNVDPSTISKTKSMQRRKRG